MEHKSGFSQAMGTVGTLLLGACLGAGIALLLTPKTGSELRDELAQGASRMGETLSEAGKDVAETVKTRINQLGSKAEACRETAEGADTPEQQ